MNRQTSSQKIVVIFPAKNEEVVLFEHVITTAKKSRYNPEVIVVDAYSSDATVEKAKKLGREWLNKMIECFLRKGSP